MAKKLKKMKIAHTRKINEDIKKSSDTEKNKVQKEQIELFDYADKKNKKEIEMNTKDYENFSENINKSEESNKEFNIDFTKKIKKKIRDTNLRNFFSFILEEHTKSTFANKIFDILSLRKIKFIYYSLLTLYNFYLDKNKALSSAVLMCISLLLIQLNLK